MKVNNNKLIPFPLINRLFITICFIFLNSFTPNLLAGTIDIKLTNPQQVNGKYCINMQAKSQGVDLRVGNSTIMFHYSTPAIRHPKAKPINLAPQPCVDSGEANIYSGGFTSIEDDALGDGIYNLVLTKPFTACPLVTKEWLTISEICFDVIDPNKHVNLVINEQTTIVRTDANSSARHQLGNTKGIKQLAYAVCNDNTQNGTEMGIDCGGVCIFCSEVAEDEDLDPTDETNDEDDIIFAPDLNGGPGPDLEVVIDEEEDEDIDPTDETELADEGVDLNPPDEEDTATGEIDMDDGVDLNPPDEDDTESDDLDPTDISYCKARGKNTTYEWIEGFSLGDIENISKNDEGYGDHTTMITTLDREKSYPFTLKPGFEDKKYFETWCIFVDWNQDNDFNDEDEQVFSKRSDETITDALKVPPHALKGATRLRIIMGYDRKPIKPCRNVKWGEVEDYKLQIAGDPLPNFVRYCQPNNTPNTSYEWIKDVVIGTFQNSSQSDDGYGDFTDQTIGLNIGKNYDLVLQTSYANPAKKYKEYWVVFIDYNQDKDFDDPGELVFDSQKGFIEKVTGQFQIPTTALLGTSRLRVVMKFGKKAPSACGEGVRWGEVEDYSVDIKEE